MSAPPRCILSVFNSWTAKVELTFISDGFIKSGRQVRVRGWGTPDKYQKGP